MYDKINTYQKEDYLLARELGKKQLIISRIKGQDGFLPTLEDKLENYSNTQSQKGSYYSGFINPRSIRGTFDIGRKYCFSKNFMPLAKSNHGDFRLKWEKVLENIPHWLESGNKIQLYEFLHKLYVVEGNKRTSVARYKNLPFVDVQIKRIIPDINTNNTLEVKLYHDFLEFEKKTNISSIWFSIENEFQELEKFIDFYYISSEDKYYKFIKEVFYPFKTTFNHIAKDEDLDIVGDIFLNYLEKYDLEKVNEYSKKEQKKLIQKSIKEVKKEIKTKDI